MGHVACTAHSRRIVIVGKKVHAFAKQNPAKFREIRESR